MVITSNIVVFATTNDGGRADAGGQGMAGPGERAAEGGVEAAQRQL